MPEYLDNGSVIFSKAEIQELNNFVDRIERTYQKYQDLKNQHEILTKCHSYAVFCRDAFEDENILLRTQLKSDLHLRIHQIETEVHVVRNASL